MVGTRNKPSNTNFSSPRTVRSPTKRPSSPNRAGTPSLVSTPTKCRNTSPDRASAPKSTRTPTKQRNLSPGRVGTPTKRRDISIDGANTPKSNRTPTKQRNHSPDRVSTPTKRRDTSPDRASTPKSTRTPTKRRDILIDEASTPKSIRTPTKQRNHSPDRVSTPTKRRDTSPERASTPKSTRTPTKQRNVSPEMVITSRSLRTPTTKLNIPSDQVDTPSCRTPTTSRTPCAISNLGTPMTEIDIARMKLHVSAVSDTPSGRSSLPGPLIRRENEFKTMHTFLSEKIRSKSSGYMYISGNPGSGKTASVHRVIRRLQSERRSTARFKYMEINGLSLNHPSRAYCKILEQLNEEIASANQALKSLNRIFSSRTLKQLPVILFIDEMDNLYNRSSTVMTNILKWHQEPNSQLTILTVANDDDLISSLKDNFHGKIKITQLLFENYSYHDLEKIVMERLQGSNLNPDVVEFVIKKCASENGDARRMLEISRKILDIVTEDRNSVSDITLSDVQTACQKISADPLVLTIKDFIPGEKILLRTLADEASAVDGEGCSPNTLYPRIRAMWCLTEGEPYPTIQDVCTIAANLKDCGFLKTEDRYVNIHSKIKLDIDAKLINTALFLS